MLYRKLGDTEQALAPFPAQPGGPRGVIFDPPVMNLFNDPKKEFGGKYGAVLPEQSKRWPTRFSEQGSGQGLSEIDHERLRKADIVWEDNSG